MSTHIAVEEGRDIEEVAEWSARRRLLHVQMLGSYHEFKREQTEQNTGHGTHGVNPDTMSQTQNLPQSAQQAGGMVPSSPGAPSGADPTSRHGVQYDVANEDVDWQFCEQCHGLFEPGEYEAHFNSGEFDCQSG